MTIFLAFAVNTKSIVSEKNIKKIRLAAKLNLLLLKSLKPNQSGLKSKK